MKTYRSKNKENLKTSVKLGKIYRTHWILPNMKCSHVQSFFKPIRINIPKVRNDPRMQTRNIGRIHMKKYI